MNKKPSIVLLFLLLSFLKSAISYGQTKDYIVKADLRAVAHEFLLQLNDSTSRILPITKKDNRYTIKFENEFSFEPDLLLFALYKIYEDKTDIDLIAEVETCDNNAIIYSVNTAHLRNKKSETCKLRKLPKDCHIIHFTILEKEPLLKKENNKEASNKSIYYFILAFVGSLLFFWIKNKSRKKDTSKNNTLKIGDYTFDTINMLLIYKDTKTELSSKENDLLHLLITNKNTTLKRDDILNKVWGDDGNYIGRTLDVYISKLRKKLEKDDSIKIINVRSVGYKIIFPD